jgi:hypothetical protein
MGKLTAGVLALGLALSSAYAVACSSEKAKDVANRDEHSGKTQELTCRCLQYARRVPLVSRRVCFLGCVAGIAAFGSEQIDPWHTLRCSKHITVRSPGRARDIQHGPTRSSPRQGSLACRRHPWIFAAAVDRLSGPPGPVIRSTSSPPTVGPWRRRRGARSRRSAPGMDL